MSALTWFQKLLKWEIDTPQKEEQPTTERWESKVGKFFNWISELYDRAKTKTTDILYKNAYEDDPNTINKILWKEVSRDDVELSTTSFWDNPYGSIAGFVYKTIKPGDYKNKMKKTEWLYQQTYDTYRWIKQQINMLEDEHKQWNLDAQSYRNWVYELAKSWLDYYNSIAENAGLGKMTNFSDMERSLLKLDDIYQTKAIYDEERDVIKKDTFSILEPKYSEAVKQKAEELSTDYSNTLQTSINKLADQKDFQSRKFNGVELNNYAMVEAAKNIFGKLSEDYSQMLDVRNTLMNIQEENPDIDFSGEIQRIDNKLEDAKKKHTLYMDTYINNVGKEWRQSIDDFSRSFKDTTWLDVGNLFADERLWWAVNITDVRQAQIIKDRALVKRDVLNMAKMDDIWRLMPTNLVSPIAVIDWKLKVKAPTALSLASLIRWSLVTPTVKNLSNKVNQILHAGSTTEFYDSGMNMLKSASFNLDQSRDYNLTNFLRKSAELAPDAAEFLIPIGKVATVQNMLWKWTTSAAKVAKYSSSIAKATRFTLWALPETEKAMTLLTKVKPSVGTQFLRWLLHTTIDINLINAPFETRNPREYNGMDALFDLSFNAVEIAFKIGKANWSISNALRWDELKKNNTFLKEVYKDTAFISQGMTAKQAEAAWTMLPAVEKQDALVVAKNFMNLWERYDSLAFMMWINPKEYKWYQDAIKGINNEARQKWLTRGNLTEEEMSDIVNKQIVQMQQPQLLKDWEEYQKLMKNTQLNTKAYRPKWEEITDTILSDSIAKIETKELQQEWFETLKTELNNVNKMLDEWVWDKAELLNRRQLYINWLNYYNKMKNNFNNILSVNANNSVDWNISRLLWKFGYNPETEIKKLTSDLKKQNYQSVDGKSIDDWTDVQTQYFIGLDNEVYPVQVRDFVHTPSGKSFRILKVTGDDGKVVFHRENFKVKNAESFISNRLITSEVDALRKIEEFEEIASGAKKQTTVMNDQQVMDSFNKFINEYKHTPVIKYIDMITDIVDSSQWRIIRNIADKNVIQQPVTDAIYNRFAHELSVEIWKNPEQGLDMTVANRIANKYDITLDETFWELLYGYENLKEFSMLADRYNKLNPELRSKQTVDNVTDALKSYDKFLNLNSIVKPRTIDQTKKTRKTLVNERTETKNKAEAEGNQSLVEAADRNIYSLWTISYDYTDLSSVETKAKWFRTKPILWVNRFVKNLLPQAKDYLPIQFQNWYKEYMRLNSVFYTVGAEGKQLAEIIPIKWSVKYQEFLDDLKSAITKRWDQANITDIEQVSAREALTDREKDVLTIWDTAQRYYEDMAFLCKETFGETYMTKPLTDPERWLDIIRKANENESIFYFLSQSDPKLYKTMTDAKGMKEYIDMYGLPITMKWSDEIKFGKIWEIITDLARQGKGNAIIRGLTKLGIWPERSRRIWNFTTWWAYILGTTILNPTLLPSQLFINGIGLTTDGVFRWARKEFQALGDPKFWSHKEIDELMKTYGILTDVTDNIPLIPKTTNIWWIRKHFSNPRVSKKLTEFWKNITNAWLYNFTEMAFDKAFKTQRVLETIIADRGIKNVDEFNAYIKNMSLEQQQRFIRDINEAATKRYVYKTGNSFTWLEKFYFGNDLNFVWKMTKWFMRSISLLANWWYTHVRSLSDLLTWYNLNKIALANFESGKWTLRDSKKLVENLLNYNYDYEMLINKLFFTMNVWRKIDRISNNDIEEDNVAEKLSDTADYAKYLYAPFAWLESTPIYRILTQTFGAAMLAGKNEEFDLNAIQAAGTAMLSRIMWEAKRRFVIPWAITQWISSAVNDPNVEWLWETFWQMFASWKQSTAGFGYFIWRDLEYYGYTPDMPYTPQSELALFMPEWNKRKDKFMKLNTLDQMAELQKTDKTYRDYFKYRLPIWRDMEIGKFWRITQWDNIFKIRADWDKMNNVDAVNAYVVNTDKRWNELNKWELKLNSDLDAGSYVFNLLTQHATQPFSNKAQYEWTKQFMENFAKKYQFKTDDWEWLPLENLNNKESLFVKNLFKLADQDKLSTYFSEFTKADDNKQKQWLYLLAFLEAQMRAAGDWANVPWAQRELVASLAQDMYYAMSNQVKNEKWYERNTWLSEVDPQADAQIKYYIADKLGDTLYNTDKSSRVSLGRYFARDEAIKNNDRIVNLFSSKYTEDKNGNQVLKYGDVDIKREKWWEEDKDSKNIQATQFNNLYLLTNIQLAEGKLSADKMYVGLSSILSPKKAKETYDAPYVYNAMMMSKIIAETIDNSILPTQDKSSAKAGLFWALIPYLSKVPQSVIDEIGEERYRQLQDWVRGTAKDVNQLVYNIWMKQLQDGEYQAPSEATGTLLDLYNSNGNYKNTYWSKDPVSSYNNSKKYYDTVSRYYRNNYAKLPKTEIKVSNTYGKNSYYKNLYLKFADAVSQNIPWWAGRWSRTTTGFTLKWWKPIRLSPATWKKKQLPGAAWLIGRDWLITRSTRSTKYPNITPTYIETKWR